MDVGHAYVTAAALPDHLLDPLEYALVIGQRQGNSQHRNRARRADHCGHRVLGGIGLHWG